MSSIPINSTVCIKTPVTAFFAAFFQKELAGHLLMMHGLLGNGIKGVRKWHKMKSSGTKKKGKLQQHFSSHSHNKELKGFARFMTPTQ